MAFQDATVTATTAVSPDCTQYVVELDEGTFTGEAGQHTAIRTENGVKPYSTIAVDGARVVLMLRAYGVGGVADAVATRSVGDSLQVRSRLTGSLTLQRTDRPAVFVGTGTGITPLLGILHAYVTGGGPRAVFMFGEKSRDQLLYKGLLEQYALVHPVETRFSLSREDWSGHTGYIQEQIPDVVDSVGHEADYYACGVPAAVVAAKDKLDSLGVPDEHVHTEGWEDSQVS